MLCDVTGRMQARMVTMASVLRILINRGQVGNYRQRLCPSRKLRRRGGTSGCNERSAVDAMLSRALSNHPPPGGKMGAWNVVTLPGRGRLRCTRTAINANVAATVYRSPDEGDNEWRQ